MGSSQPTRSWYQSFTDPDVDAPYFGRLTEALRSAADPSTEIDVHGIQPGNRYLHPITEFLCAATVIKNALAAAREGYDAFVIGLAGLPVAVMMAETAVRLRRLNGTSNEQAIDLRSSRTRRSRGVRSGLRP